MCKERIAEIDTEIAKLQAEKEQLLLTLNESLSYKDKILNLFELDTFGYADMISEPFDQIHEDYITHLNDKYGNRHWVTDLLIDQNYEKYETVDWNDYIRYIENNKRGDVIDLFSNRSNQERWTVVVEDAYKALYEFAVEKKLLGYKIDW